MKIPTSPRLIRLNTIRTRLTLGYVLLLAVIIVGFSVYLQYELELTIAAQIDAYLQLDAEQVGIDGQESTTISSLIATRASLLRLILIGLPIALIVAGFAGMFMARRALRPVDEITRTVQAINATDMTRRIPAQPSPDEIGRLTETLNSMLDRLQAGFDKESRFTADASHELRTPLTAIKGQIGVALSRPRTPDEYQTTLNQIQHETDRLIRLANDLLFLTRLDAATPVRETPESIDLSDLLGAVVDQLCIIAADKRITITSDIPDSLPIMGVTDHLIRLFLNLMDNAVKYTPIGGSIHVTAEQAKHEVCIMIRDTGKGIAPEHLPHVFERFYRAESDRKYSGGTGLGLAIAHQIVREHAGSIRVDSKVGAGTCITVCLPKAAHIN